MANCLVIEHVVPEPAWAVADALARAGVRAEVALLAVEVPELSPQPAMA
jgi:hypothetical protein